MEEVSVDKETRTENAESADFYAQLYDDAWRSEDSDGTTLSEVPADFFESKDNDFTNGHNDDLVSNAITEVSLDFLSGSRAANTCQRVEDSDDSQTSSDSGLKTMLISKGSYAKYPETNAGLSDNDWNPYGTESDSNITPRLASNDRVVKQVGSRGLSQLSFDPPLSSTELSHFNASCPQPEQGFNFSDISEVTESNTQHTLKLYHSLDSSLTSETSQSMPNVESCRLKSRTAEDLNKTFRDEGLETKTQPSTRSSSRIKSVTDENKFKSIDKLGQIMVEAKSKRNHSNAVIDYDALQRDLQEIQDSLKRTLGPDSNPRAQDSPRSSECDIIPSTTTTPERSKTVWAVVPNVLLEKKEMMTRTQPASGYNSDGDEAHTSGSSDKAEDHAEAYATDFSLRPDGIKSQEANLLLTDSGNQKSQPRNLNGQGLAEKVLRILASEDPNHQVNGILTDVTVNERDLMSKYNGFSFSNDIDDGVLFEWAKVRQKLELSDLSSGRASFSELAPKSFSATDGVTQFLSHEMAAMSGRSFMHNRDLRIPHQVIECYPVMRDGNLEGDNFSSGTKSEAVDTRQMERPGTESEPQLPMSDAGSTAAGTQVNVMKSNSVLLNQQTNNNSSRSQEASPVSSDSDSSASRWKEKYRPYKPAGSKQVYYAESDAVSVADSVTTVESSHLGSDDARGPVLPTSVLGSRADPPNSSVGIYSTHKCTEASQSAQALAPIPEKPSIDEQESEASKGTSLESNKSQNHRQMPLKPTNGAEQKDSMGKIIVTEAISSKKPEHDPEVFKPQGEYVERSLPLAERRALVLDEDFSRQPRHRNIVKRDENLHRQERKDDDDNMNNGRNLQGIPFNSGYEHHRGGNIRFTEGRQVTDSGVGRTSSSVRDVYISQAFHRALSPDILESIGRRSPLLSSTIERSLAQPPAMNRHDQTARYKYQAPTFLARDRQSEKDKEQTYRGVSQRRKDHKEGETRRQAWSEANTEKIGECLRQDRGGGQSTTSSEKPTRDAHFLSTDESAPTKSLERVDQQSVFPEAGRVYAGRNVEITLDGMSTDSQETEVDHEPVSQRAKLLTQALTQDSKLTLPQDINRLWEKFLAANQSLDSSLDSTRVNDVADLLRNPAQHLIAQYMREREEYRIQRLERSQAEREKKRKEQESLVHGHLKNKSQNVPVENGHKNSTNNKRGTKNGDKNSESLFSIMEDASFERTPSKSPSKAKVQRQQHLIDPQMSKLRERITSQRKTAEREASKERQRMEKLKKLEKLLIATKQGKISNQTFNRHLEDISLSGTDQSSITQSSAVSDNSQDGRPLSDSGDTTPLSHESTTVKDSSTEIMTWKAEKSRRLQSEKGKKPISKQKTKADTGRNVYYDQRKLFQLVSDGYLTPDEAYALFLQNDHNSISVESESSGNMSYNIKPHKLYSPYVRNQHQMYHPVPKLKLSPRVNDQRSRSLQVARSSENTHPKVFHSSKNQRSFSFQDTGELADENGSRSILSDDVSSVHKDEQLRGRDDSMHTFSFLSSAGFPSAGKHSHKQDPQTSSKENKKDYKKAGLPVDIEKKHDYPSSPVSSPKKGIAWQIPLATKDKPSRTKPKVQPLKEIPMFNKNTDSIRINPASGSFKSKTGLNIWDMNDHPEGIPRKLWEKVVRQDPLASKVNHWDVDPFKDKVQYILDRHAVGEGSEETQPGKNGQEISLQDCFLAKKQSFISKCRERQKRIALARENRHLQECLRLEREAIFGEQERATPSNLFAHPYSDNLFQPKRRALTKQEMKTLTSKRYQKLPEVLQKQAKSKQSEEMKTNRLRLKIFNRKVQRDARTKYTKRLYR